MTCITPPALTDAVLLRYLDGEASEGTLEHLAACSTCRVRADELATIQGYLVRKLFRTECPPPLLLAEFRENMLPKKKAKQIRTHLDECPHCRAEQESMAAYLETLRPNLEYSPAERVRVLVGRLANKLEGISTSGPDLVPQPVRLRGGPTPTRVYLAGEYQVVFELEPDRQVSSAWSLNGLLIGEDPQGWSAALTQAGQEVKQSTVSAAGNFVLEGISPGTYDLTLSKELERILIYAVIIPNGQG